MSMMLFIFSWRVPRSNRRVDSAAQPFSIHLRVKLPAARAMSQKGTPPMGEVLLSPDCSALKAAPLLGNARTRKSSAPAAKASVPLVQSPSGAKGRRSTPRSMWYCSYPASCSSWATSLAASSTAAATAIEIVTLFALQFARSFSTTGSGITRGVRMFLLCSAVYSVPGSICSGIIILWLPEASIFGMSNNRSEAVGWSG
mmetsp:Transcript_80843/g.218943  ORF Transcript_80843/g.218943 Transcript_80843/m.218943 type:complete len:200 (+) Transcript_80843:1180-1779(+)